MATIKRGIRGNRQAGQALYLTALSLVVLTGFLGLGIDMGALRYEKRLQQTAADAAAIAAASDLDYGGITEAALAASEKNGFLDNDGGNGCGSDASVGAICVQPNHPPVSGSHACGTDPNCNNYVEVVVAAVHPTYFMRIFGVTKETVSARAVATNVGGGPNTPCLLSLSASANVIVKGTINANLCSILTNGGLSISGGGTISGATSIGAGGECSGSSVPACVSGIPPIADPLAYLPPQTASGTGCTPIGLLGTLGLNVCNGLSIGPGTTSLADGLYVVNGVLSVAAGANLDAPGAMLYLPSGTVNLNAGSTVTASAVVAQTINLSANVTLNLGGSGASAIKSAVLVE